MMSDAGLGLGIGRALGETHGYVFRIGGGQYAPAVVDQQESTVVKVLDGENRLVVEAKVHAPMACARSGLADRRVTACTRSGEGGLKAPPGGMKSCSNCAPQGGGSRRLSRRAVLRRVAAERWRGKFGAQAVRKFGQALQWAAPRRARQAVTLYGLAWSFLLRASFKAALLRGARTANDGAGRRFRQAINNIGLSCA
jgi:hypothetical protein